MKQLPKGQYNFKEVEEKILNFWHSKPFFKPEFDPKSSRLQSLDEFKSDTQDKWVLVCPPPNAYDRPHMGNLSGYPYMDAMGRYQRMKGKRVLLFPGKDHAGIEGEVTYIKYFLEPNGKSKFDFTREEFFQKLWDSQVIYRELCQRDEKSTGLSADFDRDLYTMDPKVVNEVLGTFVQMYNDGLIYKGVRIVNWDPKSHSAISDSQCERKQVQGKLYYIKYPATKGRVWRISDSDFRISVGEAGELYHSAMIIPSDIGIMVDDVKEGDLIICPGLSNPHISVIQKVSSARIFRSFDEAWSNFEQHKVYTNGEINPKTLEDLKNKLRSLYPDKSSGLEKGSLAFVTLSRLDESDYLMVATTRPETMLGDTALVVNPTDERYLDFVGKAAIVPIVNRCVPIITSGRVEKDFGTGVLKLTPAHAPDDWEIMTEWNLHIEKLQRDNPAVYDPVKHIKIGYLNVIGKDLNMCGPVPYEYKYLKVDEAKNKVINHLKSLGLLVKEESITQNVLVSERTGAVIQPLVSSQWFIDVSPLKQKLIEVVTSGELKIYPKSAEKKYLSWVSNLRDWAISRNLWWGYRLPVWYKGQVVEEINEDGQVILKIKRHEGDDGYIDLDQANSDHMRVQIDSPGEGWIQDDDILDTWFSSGQWPYLCLKTANLMDLYPTDALVSGYDLLIKWDLFMVLFGIYKTGRSPFKDLFLTGLVKGTDGQKMSKSRGNFVPIDDVKDQFGMDAFRMNCFYQNKAGRSYSITPDSLRNFRNFNNKIWNASKFVMMHLEGIEGNPRFNELNKMNVSELVDIFSANKWKLQIDLNEGDVLSNIDIPMLEEIRDLWEEYNRLFSEYKFGLITSKLYKSFWSGFCDNYIEKVKYRVWKDSKDPKSVHVTSDSRFAAQATLYKALVYYLKMLHPFIPFITEEIWQHLVEDGRYERPMMFA